MRDPSGTSRGFAFLTFEDAIAVNAVVAREHTLDGKPVRVSEPQTGIIAEQYQIDPKRAIPREEHLRNTRYFVGGLAPTSTSDTMREFFAAYGKVVDATVMVDRESGRSKGFGFVTFEDASNADQLVGKIGLILDDKQVKNNFNILGFRLIYDPNRSKLRWLNHAVNAIKHGQPQRPLAAASPVSQIRHHEQCLRTCRSRNNQIKCR